MTLTFLGQTYDANVTEVTPTQLDITGCYRGIPIQFAVPQGAPRSSVTLTYRGTRYTR